MRIEAQLGLRLSEQAERGLSTIAFGVRPVRAIVNSLQTPARCRNHDMEAGVHLFDPLAREETSADSRLIADDEQAMSAAVPPLERLGGARCEFQFCGITHVAPIDHESSIAIQDDHPVAGGSASHDPVNTAAR